MNEPRICKVCGKPFFAKTVNQIFCSPECYDKQHHPKSPMQRKKCPICGKEFETTNSLTKYCSEECKVTGRRENDRKSKKNREEKKPPKTRICKICGKSFVPKNGNQGCCSLECSNQNAKNNRAEWEAKKISCVVCGKKFVPKVKNHQMCCSPACSAEHQRRKRAEAWHRRKETAEPVKKVCPVCGKAFAAEPPNRKYCSSECIREYQRRKSAEDWQQHKATTEPKKRLCVICGQEFMVHGRQICCSPECAKERTRRQQEEFRMKKQGRQDALRIRRLPKRKKGFSSAFWDRFGGSENMQNIVKVMHQCKAAGYENDYGRFVAEGKLDLEKLNKLEFVGVEE